MPYLRYVGSKPTKTDNVAGTGVTWQGQGDVQEVPDRALPLMLQHPAVWELASAEDVAPPAEEPEDEVPPQGLRFAHSPIPDGTVLALRDLESDEVMDLTLLGDTELKTFARVNGIKADLRKKGDDLRGVIVATVIFETEKAAAAVLAATKE